tara:strand:- start:1768 stop:2712 length:945 start_codon:yes stop_codon:yes gene_type:complete
MAIEWHPKESPMQGMVGLWGGTQGALTSGGAEQLPFMGGRAVWMCGYSGGATNNAEYVSIESGANTSDFGDMAQSRWGATGTSNASRGLCSGGGNSPSYGIDYITISSTGNATAFGNLTVNRRDTAGVSNGDWSVVFGGYSPGDTVLDYVSIDTTGNASTFGGASDSGYGAGPCSNGTYGCYIEGANIQGGQYITIATTGNSSMFQNSWPYDGSGSAGASGDQANNRGITSYSSAISYFTISTLSSGASFGTNNVGGTYISGASDGSKFVFGGANGNNTISYVDIASTGNSSGFGNFSSGNGAYYRSCTSGDPS